jgi:hypothetical protein
MQLKNASTAKELNVQRGTANALQSKFLRVRSSLLRWFRQSRLRLTVLEIRCFPLRIVASINAQSLRYGNTTYAANRDRSMGSFAAESTHQRECIRHMEALRRNHHWVGPLDLEIAAQSHREGALWAIDNHGRLSSPCKKILKTEQIGSSPWRSPKSGHTLSLQNRP